MMEALRTKVNPNVNMRDIKTCNDRIKNLLTSIKTTSDPTRQSELLKSIKTQSDRISDEIGGSQPVPRRLRMSRLQRQQE